MTSRVPPYPMLLKPALKVKVWGGRRLETLLGKALPTSEPYGESWEMHDSAVIANGELAGKTVGEALAEYGMALVGEGNDPAEGMPLLAKFLDAHDWLSVQVHPNDEQAHEMEGEPRGKTEAWLILSAEPGAQLVAGVKRGTTREQIADAIRQGHVQDHLFYAEVKAGDVLFNHAGGVHALGPGIVIYEIQQSSDTTYRLFDWNRLDLNGQPRTLHIEKGVHVIDFDEPPNIKHAADDDDSPVRELVRCEYFVTLEHHLKPGPLETTVQTRGKFQILTALDTAVHVEAAGTEIVLEHGQTALIPAALTAFTMRADAPARVIRAFQ